jgi:hypothetical protein
MEEVSLQLGLLYEDPEADTGGGFIFPITLPYVTLPPTHTQFQLNIGGDAPAYPIVRFNGPVVNPRLITDDWSLGVDMTIESGQYVDIDTRPWKQTAMLNGSASVAGKLTRRTRLAKVSFTPGERFDAKYVGFSSGVSTCRIQWAPTWNSI